MKTGFAIFLMIFLLGGCATLADVDRSALGHPGMDLQNSNLPQPAYFLFPAGVADLKTGESCTVCAH